MNNKYTYRLDNLHNASNLATLVGASKTGLVKRLLVSGWSSSSSVLRPFKTHFLVVVVVVVVVVDDVVVENSHNS